MWAIRHFEEHLLKLSPLLSRGLTYHLTDGTSIITKASCYTTSLYGSVSCFRLMSTMRDMDSRSSMKGRGMRAKVEKRMQRESSKTRIEQRRSKRIHKMLMTEEEKLIFSLRRAKKKVALLLQKLKKYELPELPQPLHDPELLTNEQLQAYKKIGFRNRNYAQVGVRGVFGGVVQNMHMHWKFHETVQVCCDNFPKEKIREMATMLARLSGGIVVNIHNVKTIIMFRGRNYRQPKNLIPINTLTKRKALFKARFEQALESQKLNIKKIEQQLRRKGISPEDPIAMASIRKVAGIFFRAVDEKQGTPYVFRGDAEPVPETDGKWEGDEAEMPQEYSDQEELDRFIAEIEQAADLEFEKEEATEMEEASRIRYWNRHDGSAYGMLRGRSENWKNSDSDNDDDDDDGDDDEDDDDSGRQRRFNKADSAGRSQNGKNLELDGDDRGHQRRFSRADSMGRSSNWKNSGPVDDDDRGLQRRFDRADSLRGRNAPKKKWDEEEDDDAEDASGGDEWESDDEDASGGDEWESDDEDDNLTAALEKSDAANVEENQSRRTEKHEKEWR